MTDFVTVVKIVNKLIDNLGEQIDTLSKLRRILLIAQIEPRVMKEACSTKIADVWRVSGMLPDLKRSMFCIRFADGDEVQIPLADISRDLWPADIRTIVERKERVDARRKERRNQHQKETTQ